jgi:hypothetical protein
VIARIPRSVPPLQERVCVDLTRAVEWLSMGRRQGWVPTLEPVAWIEDGAPVAGWLVCLFPPDVLAAPAAELLSRSEV